MTQRGRKRYRRSRGSLRRKVLVAFGVLVAAITLPVVGVGIWVLSVRADTPPLDQLKPVREGSNSVVFAADGSRLGYIQSDTIRRPRHRLEDPQLLDHATVAIEDEHFYEHSGIDYSAIVRAGWRTSRPARRCRAARRSPSSWSATSTSPTRRRPSRERSARRPGDGVRAEVLEAQILTKYLNTASYGTTDGRTAVGVQAAAETYFSKPVSKLDLPEAALIAGLPQAPSDYNPLFNPKAAPAAPQRGAAGDGAADYITPRQYDEAHATASGWTAATSTRRSTSRTSSTTSQQQLIDKYGVNTVRNGGLKVYTTIDPQPAGGGGAGGRRLRRRSEEDPPRRSPRSTPRTATFWRWPRRNRTTPTSQFNFAAERPPPAGLLVQALRARDRDQARGSTPTPPTTTAPARSP